MKHLSGFVCAEQSSSDRVLYLDIDRFHFKSIGFDSDILHRAFDRCYPFF